jgi:chaperonin GroEL
MNKPNFNVKKISEGIDIAFDTTAPTLGAAGKNMIFRSFYSRNPINSNDGITLLRMLALPNDALQMGIDYIKQAAARTNEKVGDATTTTVILGKHMKDIGLKLVNPSRWMFWKKPVNAMILKREIDDAVKYVTSELKKRLYKIESDEDLLKIANISVENPTIAKTIADSVRKVGENGLVLVEESKGMEIVTEEIEGLRFDKGWTNPYMVTNVQKMEAVLKDVPVLVTDKTFHMNDDILNLIDEINSRGIKSLLIVCEDMQGEILQTIIENRVQGKFHAVIVQKPMDEEVLADIGIFTGCERMTSDKHGASFGAEDFALLGKAKKVIVTKDSTTIIGGAGDQIKIEDRIASIKHQMLDATEYKKENLTERLAKFVGKVIVIKVGAPTEADMKYLKDKIDDSVSATKAALEEGVVIGGGKTLYEIAQKKPETYGEQVVFYACQQPIKQIIKNAGFNPNKEIKNLNAGEVWNSLTCKKETNPISIGLIDPVKAERCSLEFAANSIGNFLTSFGYFEDIGKIE